MRTTIVLREDLSRRLGPLAAHKKLSVFINTCIEDYVRRQAKEKTLKHLQKCYATAARTPTHRNLAKIEVEDWPEW